MIHGKNRIGFSLSAKGEETFKAFNPQTLEYLEEDFSCASSEEVEEACRLATEAYNSYRNFTGEEKAAFLDSIAEEIINLGNKLINRASTETGLPEARIKGEVGRTVNQIKMFSALLREGSWVEASIDKPLPDREPVPKPDIRRMLRPIGPVVVFSASNFPLAFSTAGGDTISALAAGNPVIVKAHPLHPGTNQLVAEAINKAATKKNIPNGTFSTLYDSGYHVGLQLVKHPNIKSVAFTGSFSGGMAIYRANAERTDPIPVFAEMGSLNPVILLPGKLSADYQSIAKTLAGSITLGAGQFCTNPGLIAALDGECLTNFTNEISNEIRNSIGQTMLNEGIWVSFKDKKTNILKEKGIELIAETKENTSDLESKPTVATVKFKNFNSNPTLHEEVFGPFSLIVKCENKEELLQFAENINGQLTTSLFANESDNKEFQWLFNKLEEKSGRLIFNGAPTGVEVCHSMQHGGPFPATTDSRFTSVGSEAIKRFVRPVAYQNAPSLVLPDELKDGNPLGIWRKIDGDPTKS